MAVGLGYAQLGIRLAHDEIRYNVEIMETTLQDPQKAKNLDSEFFFLFQQALDELRPIPHSSLEIQASQQLSIKLQQLAGRLHDIAGVCLTLQDVHVPLCRPPVRPDAMIDSDTPPTTAIGLHLLGSVADCIRIRGDGHCLFRAVAVGLHIHYKDSLPAFRQKMIELRKGIGKDIDPPLWDRVLSSFDRCSPPADVLQLMSDPSFSDSWMALVRKLTEAGLWEKWRNPPTSSWRETFVASLPEKFTASPEDYIKVIGDPSQREFGGEAEIMVLSELFLPIRVCDAQSLGVHGHLEGHEMREKNALYLLLRPGHYDLLLPREREVVASSDTLHLDQVD